MIFFREACSVIQYNCFAALARHERLNADYRILVGDVGSDISIIAPHGGKIEPKTSDLTRMIAGGKYNYYCFEGIKAENNRSLHITSHLFDEPKAINLVGASRIVVAVHACTDRRRQVYLGGLDTGLKKVMARKLEASEIKVSLDHPRFQGASRHNICNRSRRQKGVQLEISRGLRDDPDQIRVIAAAVQASLDTVAGFLEPET